MSEQRQIRFPVGENLELKFKKRFPRSAKYRILRKSVDARGKRPYWVYTLEVFGKGESAKPPDITLPTIAWNKNLPKPIVVGAGPAGLFAALRLIERGIPCRLFEQGSESKQRMRSIAAFWRYGRLDPRDNVCFGEGGAGLYSDGKLITRIKSPHIPYVLDRLVRFGAPEEIRFLANPHVGSDRIRKVIPKIRHFLLANGCEIHFNSKVTKINFERDQRVSGIAIEGGGVFRTDHLVLATGHSAEDMIECLHQQGVTIEGKSFAVGLRIEHPQQDIDAIQFGKFANHPELGASSYRLADHDKHSGVGVYSFCMCPGGYVISSGTEAGRVVSNGMSNYARNSPYANAALVVSVDHNQHFGNDIFGGMRFRREVERRASAFVLKSNGGKEFPAQRALDFLSGTDGDTLQSSSPSGVVFSRLDHLFPNALYQRLSNSLQKFDRKMPGYLSERVQLIGVETRTSSPVRVSRDPLSLQSVSHFGLYPCGEGAGYAGGITSAAVDGVKVAEAIIDHYR